MTIRHFARALTAFAGRIALLGTIATAQATAEERTRPVGDVCSLDVSQQSEMVHFRAAALPLGPRSKSGPAFGFATLLGDKLDDSGRGLAIDEAGNVYVTGWTEDTATRRITVAKYSVDGTQVYWKILLPADGAFDWAEGNAIAVDPAGHAYIAGTGRRADGSGTRGLVIKLSPDGEAVLFARSFGTEGSDRNTGTGIARHPISGRLYFCGAAYGSFRQTVGYIYASISEDGATVFYSLLAEAPPGWTVTIVASNTVGETGDHYFAGALQNLGTGEARPFAAWVISNGTFGLANIPNVTGSFRAVAVNEAAGDLLAVGAIGDDSSGDLLIARFRLSSFLRRPDTTTLPGLNRGNSVVLDPKGNAFVTGASPNGFDGGNKDVYVIKIDPFGKVIDGSLRWFGGLGYDEGFGIALADDGICVAGRTASADFPVTDGTELRGPTDAFLARLLK